jgi:aminoglycoside phosphotransferase
VTEDRLPHGYTNATRSAHGLIHKRYLGPDAPARQHAEVTALRHLAGKLPVPAVLHEQVGQIGTALMPGRPGQELLELAPEAVLTSVGRTAALLHRTVTTALATPDALGPAAPGAVLVHGDFGPQNLLLDPDTFEVSAIVDWEFAHLGDGVLDLAWAEWIVRTHHRHLSDALPSLFAGYGSEPSWGRRQAAMVAKCEWALDFVTRWAPGNQPAQAQWRDRLEATTSFAP